MRRAFSDEAFKVLAADLDALDQYFLDVVRGDIRGDAVAHVASTFFGYRGPWYTVGYLMATRIEKQLGRSVLVETLRDPRQFLATYNEAVRMQNASGARKLPLFSAEVLDSVAWKPRAPGHRQERCTAGGGWPLPTLLTPRITPRAISVMARVPAAPVLPAPFIVVANVLDVVSTTASTTSPVSRLTDTAGRVPPIAPLTW